MSKLKLEALHHILKQNQIIHDSLISMSVAIESIKHNVKENIQKKDFDKLQEYFDKLNTFDDKRKKPYGYKLSEAQIEIEKWINALIEEFEDSEG